jgi:hypothetical protein
MDNLAHKMVDTFEKMDAINPTFEQIQMDSNGQHKII